MDPKMIKRKLSWLRRMTELSLHILRLSLNNITVIKQRYRQSQLLVNNCDMLSASQNILSGTKSLL